MLPEVVVRRRVFQPVVLNNIVDIGNSLKIKKLPMG
jgi:hypothetical protein